MMSIVTRFAIVYGFQAAWWLVGQGMRVTKTWRRKAEQVDYNKVQEYLNRQNNP